MQVRGFPMAWMMWKGLAGFRMLEVPDLLSIVQWLEVWYISGIDIQGTTSHTGTLKGCGW